MSTGMGSHTDGPRWSLKDRVLRLVAWYTCLKWLWSTLHWTRTNFLLGKQDLLNKYGTPRSLAQESERSVNTTWAVVTGASSGIGESFARQLAEEGFHVVLVARRSELLRKLSKELEHKYKVQVAYISFDFMNTLENYQVLMNVIKDITGNDIGILVHMAGNSDLAKHFTDKSTARNAHVARLQVEGTLILVQEFCKLMSKRNNCRSAIITSGALPAYLPLPGFSVASGTKSFIRSFTLGVSHEFRDKIDIMCAHPIAVTSGILKSKGKIIISPSDFVCTVFKHLGHVQETNGSWLHDIFMALFMSWPMQVFQLLGWQAVPLWSKLLKREVDLRPLKQKLEDDIDSVRLVE